MTVKWDWERRLANRANIRGRAPAAATPEPIDPQKKGGKGGRGWHKGPPRRLPPPKPGRVGFNDSLTFTGTRWDHSGWWRSQHHR